MFLRFSTCCFRQMHSLKGLRSVVAVAKNGFVFWNCTGWKFRFWYFIWCIFNWSLILDPWSLISLFQETIIFVMIRKLRSCTYVLSYWAWSSGWDTHPDVGKSDLIVIDCIDQSVEIDDTLVSFIHLFWFLPISSIYIGRYILFMKRWKLNSCNQQIYWELSCNWESNDQTFITVYLSNSVKNINISFLKPGLKSFSGDWYWPGL